MCRRELRLLTAAGAFGRAFGRVFVYSGNDGNSSIVFGRYSKRPRPNGRLLAAAHKPNGGGDGESIDVQSVVSMEILETGDGRFAETHNEAVLRRVAEMQELVENSERYLNRHQRESSDSDGSHISSDGSVSLPPPLPPQTQQQLQQQQPLQQPPVNPGQLKHSDSLLLLAQVRIKAAYCYY